MKKEELKTELKKLPIFRIIGIIQIAFILLLLSSPFVWIWLNGNTAIKIFFSGLIGTIIMYFIDFIFKEALKKVINEYEEPLKLK